MCKNVKFLVLMVWIYGVLKIWRKRIADSVNERGVCRTAPATPGLLIKVMTLTYF